MNTISSSIQKATEIANDDANSGEYDFVGEVAVRCLETGEGVEFFAELKQSQCCGIVDKTITVDGLEFDYTFDWGH